MKWMELVLSVLAGLATAIPLVIQLVKYVQKAIQEKNWPVILNMLMEYMSVAEEKFSTGAERKEWVMGMIEASAKSIGYPVDLEVISKTIDDMCAMSKIVNGATEVAKPAENGGCE